MFVKDIFYTSGTIETTAFARKRQKVSNAFVPAPKTKKLKSLSREMSSGGVGSHEFHGRCSSLAADFDLLKVHGIVLDSLESSQDSLGTLARLDEYRG
jgi:hypothetical protein